MIGKFIILFLILDCGVVIGWFVAACFMAKRIDEWTVYVGHLESQMEASNRLLRAATTPKPETRFTDPASRVWWV